MNWMKHPTPLTMKARKTIRSVGLLMGLSSLAALTAPASTVDFNFRFISSYQTFTNYGDGGEYTLANLDNSSELSNSAYATTTSNQGDSRWGESLQTFCLEKSQYVYNYTTYGGIMAEGAVPGTPGDSFGIDYISIGTAYLYSQFAQGLLTDYHFDGPAAERKTDAYRLQRIFWSPFGGMILVMEILMILVVEFWTRKILVVKNWKTVRSLWK